MKMNKRIQDLCNQTGMQYDEATGVYKGRRGNYSFLMSQTPQNSLLTISFSVAGATMPDKSLVKRIRKECKPITGGTIQGHRMNFNVKVGSFSWQKTISNVQEAIDYLIQFFTHNGFANCCEMSGEVGETQAYVVGGLGKLLSEASFLTASHAVADQTQKKMNKGENMIGGFVGALLGACIGAVVIVILGQLGYISMWSGIIMGVCSIKGYDILGGRISKKGVFISCLVMIGMVYLANRIDWALTIASEFEASFSESFAAVTWVVKEYEAESTYYGNLGLTYLFAALGGIPTVIGAFRSQKAAQNSYKL